MEAAEGMNLTNMSNRNLRMTDMLSSLDTQEANGICSIKNDGQLDASLTLHEESAEALSGFCRFSIQGRSYPC
jgi:hypothetical protein